MSGQVGIRWGFNQEQQQVCQEPKTSSTADEEICNNEEQNKGSVCKLSTINGLTVMHSAHKLDATAVSMKWAGYRDVITQPIIVRKFLTSLSMFQNAYAHDCCL